MRELTAHFFPSSAQILKIASRPILLLTSAPRALPVTTELNERRGIPAIDDCTGMLLMGSGVAKTIAMACPF